MSRLDLGAEERTIEEVDRVGFEQLVRDLVDGPHARRYRTHLEGQDVGELEHVVKQI